MSTRSKARDQRFHALYGSPSTEVDAGVVLLKEIQRTAGHIEWLGSQIRNSDPDAFMRSLWILKRQSGFVREGEIDMTDFSKAGAMWLELYLTERRHLAQICRTALAAGLEERRVRLAERQAEAIGTAFRGMIIDLGDELGFSIDPEDERIREIIYRHLMQAANMPESSRNLPLAIEPASSADDTW